MSARADPLPDPYYWKKIALALLINAVSVSAVIMFLFAFGFINEPPAEVVKIFSEEKSIKTPDGEILKTSDGKDLVQMPHPFFMPVRGLFNFKRPDKSKFLEIFVANVLLEELVYRGPIMLVALFLPLKIKKKHWLVLRFLCLWLIGLYLNFVWAWEIHRGFHDLLWVPVFVAGLPWLWLVIRTNRLWPAIFCHSAANLSIYFLIKVYQFSV